MRFDIICQGISEKMGVLKKMLEFHAAKHAANTDGKPWRYLLIPHDRIAEQMTVNGLEASCWVQQYK
jgi:hypothetical protein